MSMAADIVSLELIASVHQTAEMDQATYDHLVDRLHKQVAHFEWVGLYIWEDCQLMLKASAGDQTPESLARKSILQVPITSLDQEKTLGRLTITSKQAVAFDVSDYTSLQALALEIGKKIEQLKKNHQ